VCVRENSSRDVVRNQGKWSNHEVAIKLLDRDSVPVILQLRLDIKAMRDIRHKNLAAFVGACSSSPNVCILMELGPKGSLDDSSK
jgi:serine/threonine protein kinase